MNTVRATAFSFWIAICAAVVLCSSGYAQQPVGDGAWTTAAPMPTARSEIAAAAVDGRIYVAGGLTALGTSNIFESYDPAADRWQKLPSLPLAVHHLAAVGAAGCFYITGGYDSMRFKADVRSTWSFDSKAGAWRGIADMPAPRAAHAMAEIGGKPYVAGGVGPDSIALWVYDPATDRWDASRKPLPTVREHLAAAVVDGRLYVIGGRWGGQGNLTTVEVYDPTTDRWTRKRDMPTARSGFTAAVIAGRIHVAGGESLTSSETFAQHEVYDPATDTWVRQPDLPTPRHGLASAVVADRWYVMGGGTRAGAMTLVSLTELVEVFASKR
jgi:N-acetylneuraminic acid mutarotase